MTTPGQDLDVHGFWYADEEFLSPEAALTVARTAIAGRSEADDLGALDLIGDFVLPPPDGSASRDFQTLHFDFGLPLVPRVPTDLARYTALHVPQACSAVTAATRLVPLLSLLAQREWPPAAELVDRFSAYADSHGARDDRGYTEGSLARIIEAATGATPALPSVKATPGFLCGLGFDALETEEAFLARHGLEVEAVELVLQPGQLLIFDNLAIAHGRRGCRQPGELYQWVFGHRGLAPHTQERARDRWLRVFAAR